MCTLAFAWQLVPKYPFIFVANRDEFRARPTAPLHWWQTHGGPSPDIAGGRDLEANGTWTAITRTGRFAAITNFRDPSRKKNQPPSRGTMTTAFLDSSITPAEYAESLVSASDDYLGYNLLVATLAGPSRTMSYLSNYAPSPHPLGPGLYGLSNALLDTPWPKLQKAKNILSHLIGNIYTHASAHKMANYLTDAFSDTSLAPDESLPSTGVPVELEKALSALCIDLPGYGTRVTTIIILDSDGNLYIREVPRGADAFNRPVLETSFRLTT